MTTHAAIEKVAFDLFEERGFDATTMDDIAAVVGVSRRTLFRYYPSKNDILWGQFDQSLRDFASNFAKVGQDFPLAKAIRDGIVAFNELDEAAIPQHRRRMRLLLGTPALLAHSELRYAAWRQVVANFAATRLGCAPDELLPTLAGRVALSIALTAYEQWLQREGSLADLIHDASAGLETLLRS